MKRALSTALAVLAVVPAACAGPKPKLDFGGKAVPINVAFGKPKDGEPGSVAGPSTVEVVPGAIGVVPVPRPAVSRPAGSAAPPTTATPPTTIDFGSAAPPPDPCPEAGPFAFPRADADTQVRAVAPEGDYPFRVRASTTINGNKSSSEGEFIRRVTNSKATGDGSFSFDVTSTSGADVETIQHFVATTPTDKVPGQIGLAGIESHRKPNSYSFSSAAKPLKLMQLKADRQVAWDDVASDPTTGTAVTYHGAIVDRGRVDACGQPVDSWKVTATEQVVTPNQNLVFTVATYFATQYGGLIVGEDFSYSGTVGTDNVQGEYHATVNRDPGAK